VRSLNHKKDKENGSKSYRNPAGHPIAFADKAFYETDEIREEFHAAMACLVLEIRLKEVMSR
jgi:hypothetical protein